MIINYLVHLLGLLTIQIYNQWDEMFFEEKKRHNIIISLSNIINIEGLCARSESSTNEFGQIDSNFVMIKNRN